MVRKGIVFRSADVTKLTDEGVAVMQSLGIQHVYDFRSKQEFGKTPGTEPKEWEGAQRHFVPVFPDLDLSPEALAVKLVQNNEVKRQRFRDYTEGPKASYSFPFLTFFCYPLFCSPFFLLPPPFIFFFLSGKLRQLDGRRLRLWEMR